AFEHHVFENVGKSCLAGLLINGAHPNPDHVQGRWRPPTLIDQYTQTTGQRLIQIGRMRLNGLAGKVCESKEARQ
ncbi:MAG: hypothetical protein RI968_890, partial [Pseudomonadota bacterium]